MEIPESLQLLLATHQFPGPFTFKVIGKDADGFVARVVQAVRESLHVSIDPPYRLQPSSSGRLVSVTIEPHVFTAEEVLAVYKELSQTPGVMLML